MSPRPIDLGSVWGALLREGEQILWQGRPSSRLRLEFRSPFEPLFFLVFTGFSVFWMAGASAAGGVFWMFGLLFFAIGSYQLFGIHFWRAFVRSASHYSLSSQRAFIATEIFGKRRLDSYDITRASPLSLQDGTPGSVFFAERIKRGENSDAVIPIGFEMIADARQVFSMIGRIQRGELQAPDADRKDRHG
jgi:hypothetical protein